MIRWLRTREERLMLLALDAVEDLDEDTSALDRLLRRLDRHDLRTVEYAAGLLRERARFVREGGVR